jgi:hypothetical protein
MASLHEHHEIEPGDRIILGHAPATVTSAKTYMGYRDITIRRDNGTIGRWYIGSPVWRVDPLGLAEQTACERIRAARKAAS